MCFFGGVKLFNVYVNLEKKKFPVGGRNANYFAVQAKHKHCQAIWNLC